MCVGGGGGCGDERMELIAGMREMKHQLFSKHCSGITKKTHRERARQISMRMDD